MSAKPARSPALALVLDRARRFVETRGDALARVRVAVLMQDAPPSRIEAALLPWRREDGGFAPLEASPPPTATAGTLAGTLAALAVLEEAGVGRGPLVEGAVAWAARRQADDGAWREDLPSMSSADDRDAIVLTGMLAGRLTKVGCGSPLTLARAEEFLASRFSPDLVDGGSANVLAAYAHLYANGPFESADEVLQWCGRAFEKSFRGGLLDALAAARILLLCDVGSLPGSRIDAQEIVLALVATQGEDGAFAAPDRSIRERVEATLLGLRTLLRFGSKGPGWIPA